MPINQLIARGVEPIGSGLPGVAALLQQKQQYDRRNQLIDMEMQREQASRNALGNYLQNPNDQRFAQLAEADPRTAFDVQGQRKTQEREQYEQAFRGAQWVAQSSNPKAAALSQFPQAVEELRQAGFDFDNASDDDVRGIAQRLMEHYGPMIGQGPPQPQAPGQLYPIEGPQGPEYSTAQSAIGQRPYRQPAGGNAPPSGYRWGANGTLEFIPGGPNDPTGPNSRKGSQPLRKEFRALPSVRDYETSLPILNSAKKAPDNGYGDLQLIYTVGKLLDPNSVVREGELALTIAAGSPLQRIIGTTRFTTEQGGRLTPQSRQQIMGMLQERIGAYKQAYDRDFQQYSEYATEQGYDPSLIVGKHADTAFGGDKPQGPKPGQVIDGYRFKGGDPSKQENWVKQ